MENKLNEFAKSIDNLTCVLVECHTGIERAMIHEYAESHGIKSQSARTILFDSVILYYCACCKHGYYIGDKDFSIEYDWSTTGSCLGFDMRCMKCWNTEDYDGIVSSTVSNAVILSKVSISIGKKFRGRKHGNSAVVANLNLDLNQMISRGVCITQTSDIHDILKKAS
jgi:hypothetical protein